MERSSYMEQAQTILDRVKRQQLNVEERRECAVELAAAMLNEARRIQTNQERARQAKLAGLMKDFKGKSFTVCLTDESFRSDKAARVADQINYLIDAYGVPHYLTRFEQIQFRLFHVLGSTLGSNFVPLIRRQIWKEAGVVLLPGERKQLIQRIRKMHAKGIRVNLNHIGEAILGEEEAENRIQLYLDYLRDPHVEYVSVKISSICSQIHLLAWEETLEVLSQRLKRLYREASQNLFVRPNGTAVQKFVNLDMEEYRDLHLTVALFEKTLSDPEFFDFSAGIVLQAYLPDSYLIQQELTVWAMQRIAKGGAPIKIRIVKGANLAMEKVDASIHNWPQAPYERKGDVDANYKRMVEYALVPEHAKAVRIGIGSHNLFDIAYAMVLREENGVGKYVNFEMLEGMADHMQRVVHHLTSEMLLYCPAAKQSEFQNAVSYLIRRLDENTAPKNFLHHVFSLSPGTSEWHRLANEFSIACHSTHLATMKPRRMQERYEIGRFPDRDKPFDNEPDTDWSLPENRRWIASVVSNWEERPFELIPLCVGGNEIAVGRQMITGIDPSEPDRISYQYAIAAEEDIECAVQTAERAVEKWGKTPVSERSQVIYQAANQLRLQRGNLIGAMIKDGGKTVSQADAEVSEAIDFAEYYRRSAETLASFTEIEWTPKGVIVVVSPWNFPCAIPAGGIFAALAAGNAVIFKPAPEAVLVGWTLVQALWEAGISRELLQFLPCDDRVTAPKLVGHKGISGVIFTGGTQTAEAIKKSRPDLDLMAETGGKNAIIVTELADRDLAIKEVIHSAFGHAGQKCSACSLLICVREVYEDARFRKTLRDAAMSLPVGSAWSPSTVVNPMIRPPDETLLRGLMVLEGEETWLVEPKQDPNNSHLWSPGIKLGVRKGTFMHQTELFGPVLGVMCAENLDEAIELANDTPYGLTSGLQSLDEREQEKWSRMIVAGNLYINRGITGAVVSRQPFGGCKKSAVGRGIKAGGPHYLVQLMRAKEKELPKDRLPLSGTVKLFEDYLVKFGLSAAELELWRASMESAAFHWKHTYSKESDVTKLLGQDNFLYYEPKEKLVLRFHYDDPLVEIFRILGAALTCRGSVEVSCDERLVDTFAREKIDGWNKIKNAVTIHRETEERFIQRMIEGQFSTVRLISSPSNELLSASAESLCEVVSGPVMANGYFELLHYVREVALSRDYHRYGNLGAREHEKRRPLPTLS